MVFFKLVPKLGEYLCNKSKFINKAFEKFADHITKE